MHPISVLSGRQPATFVVMLTRAILMTSLFQRRDINLSAHYERNLVNLIKRLRIQYSSPNAKFVTASLGQTVQGDTDGGGLILDAMEAVANATKYPEFKGNVAAVYTHPLEHSPGSSGGHYGKDAETYMNVGQAMGMAMVNLLKGSNAAKAN